MKVAVVALGKIGLPLAVQFATRGHDVVGVDLNPHLVEMVNAGLEPFPGEHLLAEHLADVIGDGRLRATTRYADAVPQADAVVVVVPLVVDADGAPDFTAMDSATRSLAECLSANTVVSYETTLPVGTTRSRWQPMIEQISGLNESAGVHVVFSPERVLTGRVFADLRRYPKLIGALSPEGAACAVELYRALLEFDERPDLPRPNGVWDLGSPEAAELAKLAETTYRDVNIGLANQFARFAEANHIDIQHVIEACNSQPYSHIHRPGIAVGGHCIPVYPRLYLWNDPQASVVRAARETNEGMPAHAVARLAEVHGELIGERVVVLGAAYRGGVKESALSGVFPVVAELARRGAVVSVHDPLYTDDELRLLGFEPHHLGEPADAAVLQADHPQYGDLIPTDLPGVRTLVDGRDVIDPQKWPSVRHVRIGAPLHA